jgi:hypothetical protein
MQTRLRNILMISVIALFSANCSKPVSFNKDIKPILVTNCLVCRDGSGEGSSTSGFIVKY